jgi:hypothetical protein
VPLAAEPRQTVGNHAKAAQHEKKHPLLERTRYAREVPSTLDSPPGSPAVGGAGKNHAPVKAGKTLGHAFGTFALITGLSNSPEDSMPPGGSLCSQDKHTETAASQGV